MQKDTAGYQKSQEKSRIVESFCMRCLEKNNDGNNGGNTWKRYGIKSLSCSL